MLTDIKADKIYLAVGYTDLRRGIDGLASIVQDQFQLDPFTNTLFLFCGRRRDRIKALLWEDNGFILLYKRLERGAFCWPRNGEEARMLTEQQYRWLIEGLSTDQPKALKPVTGLTVDHAITLYEYAPGRAGKYPEAFLEGFEGYLLTDGYEPYHKLNKAIVNVGCWAHLRRKFMDAQKAMPKGKSAGNTAVNTALGFCTKIFKEDKRINTLALEKRYEECQKHLKPLLDDFYAWAKTVNATPKGALGKALTYLEKQWPYLNNVLLDGRLELTNNLAERSIKPFVIDRKNFLFAVSPKGAQSSAIMFSIVETAKENKLNPYNYLCHIFKTAPNLDQTNLDWIKLLLPENAPDWCKAGKY